MNEKKNYSFYMPSDFDEKLEELQSKRPFLKALSKSQCVYFLISEMCEKDNKKEEPDSDIF